MSRSSNGASSRSASHWRSRRLRRLARAQGCHRGRLGLPSGSRGRPMRSNPTDLVVRVYRDAPLPAPPVMEGGTSLKRVRSRCLQTAPSSHRRDGRNCCRQRRSQRRRRQQPPRRAQSASVSSGTATAMGRPARLKDTAEASVVRIETIGCRETDRSLAFLGHSGGSAGNRWSGHRRFALRVSGVRQAFAPGRDPVRGGNARAACRNA